MTQMRPDDDLVFCIDPTDPMLAGHFPSEPVVPGVVLLDRALVLIAGAGGPPVSGIKSVKFIRPVLPAQPVTVRFAVAGEKMDIEALVAGEIAMRAAATISAS